MMSTRSDAPMFASVSFLMAVLLALEWPSVRGPLLIPSVHAVAVRLLVSAVATAVPVWLPRTTMFTLADPLKLVDVA